jgi:hypothetical protein
VSALEGNAVEITSANISGLTQLCEEFGFEELRAKLPESPPPAAPPAPNRPPAPTPVKVTAAPGGFDSLIVSDFPAIFAESRGKQFKLLWRGSRDGFGASQFHRRCDGHANTLTVILDTKGNIFGGFTPVEWDSTSWDKADDSEKSFLFTLKNPHNIPARRFSLNAGEKHLAIYCGSGWGPCFGRNIAIYDNCNTNTDSYAHLGITYTNGTGLGNRIVFTGSRNFRVKEIEVFEITD